jgi:hypothetical protein
MKNKFFTLLLFSTSLAFAQWNSNVTVNTTVSAVARSQSNVHLVTDSKGGAIIVWDDTRTSTLTSTDVYAQRISNAGDPRWTINGLAVCNNPATQRSAAITDAGNGSCIIAWEDSRSGNYDIYAQKIDSSGNLMWTANGVALCSGSTNQKNPKIISDNAGGAIVVWEDSLSFYWDVTAQRISSVGLSMWGTNGTTICNASNSQINPKLDVDGAGGAIITWQDKRNSLNYDIYAQRVNASGAVQWTANGELVCNALNSQTGPRIEPDGSNGAYIAWIDKRNGIDYDIYCQRLNSTGVPQWTTNGVAICTATGNQSAVDIKNIGAAGLMLAWKDTRITNEVIYAQLVSPGGTVQMSANGISISSSLRALNPNVVNDGLGGAIVAWQDSTSLGWNITSQKINSGGIIQWPAGGVTVSNAPDDQTDVVQVKDLSGGAIFAWTDHRNGSNDDVYAQHINSDGTSAVGIHENIFSGSDLIFCFPNPANDHINILSSISFLMSEINIIDVTGKTILKEQFDETRSISIKVNTLSSGIYLAAIKNKNETIYKKFVKE